jgi:hypothetical protein
MAHNFGMPFNSHSDGYPSGVYPTGRDLVRMPHENLNDENSYPGPGDDPSYESEAYLVMTQSWEPIDCCAGGTQYFRYNAPIYLPQEPAELEDAWKRRVSHATFSPFTVRIAEQAAGLIMRKPVALEMEDDSDVDPYWDEWMNDVDGYGTDINSFARRVLISSILYGHAGIMCDYSGTEPAPNLQVERESNMRPYLIEVTAKQIIGWRFEEGKPLAPVEQIRISEMVTVPFGEFGERVIRQIRVLERGKYRVYRRNQESQNGTGEAGWYLHESGNTSLDEIPLFVTYSEKVSEMVSVPPLLAIANLNISHAQRNADLQHSLHVAAMPMLVLQGFDDAEDPVCLSVNNAILLPPEGNAFMVEPASSSFQAQQDYLDKLEEQMSSLGISTIFAQKSAAETAESKRLTRTDSDSLLAIVSKDLESALQKAFNCAAQFVNLEPPKVHISRDFDLQVLDGNQVAQYLQLYMNNTITLETFLKMMRDGEVLPNIDIEEEVEKVESGKLDDMLMQQAGSYTEQGEEETPSPGRNDIRASVEERLKRMAAGPEQKEDEES